MKFKVTFQHILKFIAKPGHKETEQPAVCLVSLNRLQETARQAAI